MCTRLSLSVLLAGLPVYGFANGSVSCNAKLAELMDEVRPKLRDAVEQVNKVRHSHSLAIAMHSILFLFILRYDTYDPLYFQLTL